MQSNVKIGEIVELEIHGLGHSGEGVGRLQNLAIFVPGALAGERIRARLTQVKKSFARAELVEIVHKAPTRVESSCQFAKSCGGCQLQHLNYQHQLEQKRLLVQNALTRLGKLENVLVLPTLGMQNPWHYRNKIHLQVQQVGSRTKLGYYKEGSYQLAAALGEQNCLLVDHDINEVVGTLEKLINDQCISAFDWQKKTGLLRHIMLRRGFKTGEIMVVLVTSSQAWPKAKHFADELVKAHPKVVSVIQNINTNPGHLVLGSKNHLLAGKETILDVLNDLTFKISAASFYQVNPVQTEVLYNKALEFAELKGDEQVVDAYCGIGTIANFLARHAREVIGLEIIPAAVENAKENAALNKIANAKFMAGAVEKLLPQMITLGLKPDIVILDPPRKGCEREVLDAIAQAKVPRVVYVSCDPATLARDLGVMDRLGYKIIAAQPVDMFPWTSHVETVCKLSRKIKG